MPMVQILLELLLLIYFQENFYVDIGLNLCWYGSTQYCVSVCTYLPKPTLQMYLLERDNIILPTSVFVC